MHTCTMHAPLELNLVFALLNFVTVFPEIDRVMFGQHLAPHQLGKVDVLHLFILVILEIIFGFPIKGQLWSGVGRSLVLMRGSSACKHESLVYLKVHNRKFAVEFQVKFNHR